jgi:5-formyltetrahydrofolate cyclo-ligase
LALPAILSSKEGKMCFRSYEQLSDLKIGGLSILEPKKEMVEVIPIIEFVPFLCSDTKLNRIGFGYGFYDRHIHMIRN